MKDDQIREVTRTKTQIRGFGWGVVHFRRLSLFSNGFSAMLVETETEIADVDGYYLWWIVVLVYQDF
ncbi:hypothetical protein LINPERHAP1_LOCUS26484 [Linum perenne]